MLALTLLGFFGWELLAFGFYQSGAHSQFPGAQHGARHRFTHPKRPNGSQHPRICLRYLEKVNQNYYSKWWFDGDLPWYKVKKPPETNPGTNGPKLFTSWQIRRATIWEGKKNLKVIHPMESWLGYQGFSVTIPEKITVSNHIHPKNSRQKTGQPRSPPWNPLCFPFGNQKATQKSDGIKVEFFFEPKTKRKIKVKIKATLEMSEASLRKKMGHYLEDGLPGRTLQSKGITKGNLERGTTLFLGTYQILSTMVINHLLTGMILQVWSL